MSELPTPANKNPVTVSCICAFITPALAQKDRGGRSRMPPKHTSSAIKPIRFPLPSAMVKRSQSIGARSRGVFLHFCRCTLHRKSHAGGDDQLEDAVGLHAFTETRTQMILLALTFPSHFPIHSTACEFTRTLITPQKNWSVTWKKNQCRKKFNAFVAIGGLVLSTPSLSIHLPFHKTACSFSTVKSVVVDSADLRRSGGPSMRE
jgi:hypothetical protein